MPSAAKAGLIFGYLRRGLKPRPFKAKLKTAVSKQNKSRAVSK
jgi:hypothetical protein